MPGLVDIHCHILSGIDDGPPDMAASVAMARAACAAGIRTVAATPHLRADFPGVRVDEIAERCAALQARLREELIELDLVPGGEVSLGWALEAGDSALRLASYGQRGTDILIETPTVGGLMLPTLIGQVQSRGYRVTLAHPERLEDFQRDTDTLESLTSRGVLLQVNADGVLGNARKSRSAKLAQRLCGMSLVSVIASDGHRGSEHRPVGRLGEANYALSRLVGDEATRCLTESVPAAILSGRPLPVIPWSSGGRERGLFRRHRRD